MNSIDRQTLKYFTLLKTFPAHSCDRIVLYNYQVIVESFWKMVQELAFCWILAEKKCQDRSALTYNASRVISTSQSQIKTCINQNQNKNCLVFYVYIDIGNTRTSNIIEDLITIKFIFFLFDVFLFHHFLELPRHHWLGATPPSHLQPGGGPVKKMDK